MLHLTAHSLSALSQLVPSGLLCVGSEKTFCDFQFHFLIATNILHPERSLDGALFTDSSIQHHVGWLVVLSIVAKTYTTLTMKTGDVS